MKIEDIDFILSHFQDQTQLFPRKISTAYSNNRQFTLYNTGQVLNECIKSDFVDCRINAYPEYTEFKGIIRQPPNFIFIDLDLPNFDMDKKKLDLRLNKTLKKIEEYKGFPSVLWSGNGYHIYLPISAIVLDQESVFSKEKFPNLFSAMGKYCKWSVSEVFLKYAEIFFTSGKADPIHNPKYKSCLIRIPGSYNSKVLEKDFRLEKSGVEIIQQWDGHRIPIQLLLRDFRRWITQQELNQKLQISKKKKFQQIRLLPETSTNIDWIERLLSIPLEDNRKYCLFHILVPYLVNVRKLSTEEINNIIFNWLSKCNAVKSLDFDVTVELKNRIKYVKNFKPMSFAKLQLENNGLYQLLNSLSQ